MSIINNANPGSSVEALHAVDRIITKFSQNDKNEVFLRQKKMMRDLYPSYIITERHM